jgi:thymidylate synthase
MRIPGRNLNPFFAIAEVAWILSGHGDVETIGFFNKKMLEFQDGFEPNFHGAYGLRIRHWPREDKEKGLWLPDLDQVEAVVGKMTADPNTTQAVISLWDPQRDNLVKSKDYPCNNMVYYSLRDGVLEQTVIQRSNDLVWGTPYNAIQFTHLHALVAGMLKVKMGTLTYVIQNLHLYPDLYPDILNNLIRQTPVRCDASFELARSHRLFEPADNETVQDLWDFMHMAVEVTQNSNSHQWWTEYFRQLVDQFGTPESYWKHTLPRMLALYCYTKSTSPVEVDPKLLRTVVMDHLEEPLLGMVYDFWRGSKNPKVQEIMRVCQPSASSNL